ncbi:MAG: dihydrofolate reductase family protein [Anaerolineae bacterium]|nr:dihydrofolate reductase family protein [Anaerolineae bacterium]
MRKLIVSTMTTIDGVQENPHLWSFDYMNEELGKFAMGQLFAADAMIMGRVTYEAFSEVWASRDEADPFTERMNSLPKYVASRTLEAVLTWNATLLNGNVTDVVSQLKQEDGQDILQYGMGELTNTLLKHGLVDEVRLLVYPVAVGNGVRIFENMEKTGLKLIEMNTFDTGVIALKYQPIAEA